MQHTLFDLPKTNRCTVRVEGNTIVLKTPYDLAAVAGIKNLPYADRKWDPIRKVWLVSIGMAHQVEQLLDIYFGEEHHIPIGQVKPVQETRLLECHYIGRCKDHGDGAESAFAYLENGNWGAIFSADCLRIWFESEPAIQIPSQSATLYGIIGAKQNSTPDELKTAFRRAARTWHPDLNHDPDATEQFKNINHAYQILSDLRMRSRYDAGLALEKTLSTPRNTEYQAQVSNGYRSPLNCGYIMCEGTENLGRFIVSNILEWLDITNEKRQTLVSSWPMDAKKPLENWV